MRLSISYSTIVMLAHQILSFVVAPINGTCFGMLCTISPFVAKTCCDNLNRCCLEFQEWLMPLLTMPEGPIGGQYPGPVGGPAGVPAGVPAPPFGGGFGPQRSFMRRNYMMDLALSQTQLQQSGGSSAGKLASGQPWPGASVVGGGGGGNSATSTNGNNSINNANLPVDPARH